MDKIKIFYDLETTGLDERKHSIIQLAGVIEINDEVVEEFDIKIKPHPKAELDPYAMQINKVTPEELETYTEMTVALDQFKNILRRYPYLDQKALWDSRNSMILQSLNAGTPFWAGGRTLRT